MDTIKAIKTRRSIREYSGKKISKSSLEELVDAARFAPTARNVQPWEFIVITEKSLLKKIADITENGRFIEFSGACIVIFCEDTKYYLEDGSAATTNILNAATNFGIGSCWVAGDKKPYAPEIAKLLGVPLGFKLVSLISLGYPLDKDSFKIADKKSADKITHWGKF